MFSVFGKFLCCVHDKLKFRKDHAFLCLVNILPTKITPNLVTISRLIFNLIWLPFVFVAPRVWQIYFFFFGYFFDLLDGALARLTDRVTHLGKYLDAFSDRVNHITLFILLFKLTESNITTFKIFVFWDLFMASIIAYEFLFKKESFDHTRTSIQFIGRIILWVALIWEFNVVYQFI